MEELNINDIDSQVEIGVVCVALLYKLGKPVDSAANEVVASRGNVSELVQICEVCSVVV